MKSNVSEYTLDIYLEWKNDAPKIDLDDLMESIHRGIFEGGLKKHISTGELDFGIKTEDNGIHIHKDFYGKWVTHGKLFDSLESAFEYAKSQLKDIKEDGGR